MGPCDYAAASREAVALIFDDIVNKLFETFAKKTPTTHRHLKEVVPVRAAPCFPLLIK